MANGVLPPAVADIVRLAEEAIADAVVAPQELSKDTSSKILSEVLKISDDDVKLQALEAVLQKIDRHPFSVFADALPELKQPDVDSLNISKEEREKLKEQLKRITLLTERLKQRQASAVAIADELEGKAKDGLTRDELDSSLRPRLFSGEDLNINGYNTAMAGVALFMYRSQGKPVLDASGRKYLQDNFVDQAYPDESASIAHPLDPTLLAGVGEYKKEPTAEEIAAKAKTQAEADAKLIESAEFVLPDNKRASKVTIKQGWPFFLKLKMNSSAQCSDQKPCLVQVYINGKPLPQTISVNVNDLPNFPVSYDFKDAEKLKSPVTYAVEIEVAGIPASRKKVGDLTIQPNPKKEKAPKEPRAETTNLGNAAEETGAVDAALQRRIIQTMKAGAQHCYEKTTKRTPKTPPHLILKMGVATVTSQNADKKGYTLKADDNKRGSPEVDIVSATLGGKAFLEGETTDHEEIRVCTEGALKALALGVDAMIEPFTISSPSFLTPQGRRLSKEELTELERQANAHRLGLEK